MANIATIADAIIDELNTASSNGDFVRRFEARVLWSKRQRPLEEANVLRVDVAPINSSRRLFARGVHLIELNYDVGVRKRFEESEQSGSDIDDDEVRDLAILLDQLLTFFMPRQASNTGRPLADFTSAWVVGPGTLKDGVQKVDTTIEWEQLEGSHDTNGTRQFLGFFPLTIHVAESDAG